jgi:hypothetical protein
MDFSDDFLRRVRRAAARLAAIPERAVEPVPHTSVLIAHDGSRPGTALFKIVGRMKTILLVWEEPPGRVVWVMRPNVTPVVEAA